jgi:hypothetical protein
MEKEISTKSKIVLVALGLVFLWLRRNVKQRL